jgi:hypothetical protein
MSTILQQLPALLGVILGATGSYLITALNERSRWRREKDARWDTHRMQTYAAYGHAVKAVTLLATRAAAQRGIGELVETLPLDEALEKLSDAEANRATQWEHVLLLGDLETIAAARKWHEIAWTMTRFARGQESGQQSWAQAMNDVNDARAAFYRAARTDLGVAGHPPATS